MWTAVTFNAFEWMQQPHLHVNLKPFTVQWCRSRQTEDKLYTEAMYSFFSNSCLCCLRSWLLKLHFLSWSPSLALAFYELPGRSRICSPSAPFVFPPSLALSLSLCSTTEHRAPPRSFFICQKAKQDHCFHTTPLIITAVCTRIFKKNYACSPALRFLC